MLVCCLTGTFLDELFYNCLILLGSQAKKHFHLLDAYHKLSTLEEGKQFTQLVVNKAWQILSLIFFWGGGGYMTGQHTANSRTCCCHGSSELQFSPSAAVFPLTLASSAGYRRREWSILGQDATSGTSLEICSGTLRLNVKIHCHVEC